MSSVQRLSGGRASLLSSLLGSDCLYIAYKTFLFVNRNDLNNSNYALIGCNLANS